MKQSGAVPPGAGNDSTRVTGQAREKPGDECSMDRIAAGFIGRLRHMPDKAEPLSRHHKARRLPAE
jgi:hypothetical protein